MQSIKSFQSDVPHPAVPPMDDPIVSTEANVKDMILMNQGEKEVEREPNDIVSHSTDSSCIVVSTKATDGGVDSYYTFDAVSTSQSCDLRPLPGANLPLLLQLLLCPL